MRPVFAFTFVVSCGLSLPAAVPISLKQSVTLLMEFDGPHSERSLKEMKQELGSIMSRSGLQLDFKLLKEVSQSDSFQDLVVVKFKGSCQMETVPYLLDERGPLAYTHVSDGVVLPFSEVACDRVRQSVGSALTGDDHNRAEELFGRALGRVLAHELYHIVAQTGKHGAKGVAKSSLTGTQLITERLTFDELDSHRMQPIVLKPNNWQSRRER